MSEVLRSCCASECPIPWLHHRSPRPLFCKELAVHNLLSQLLLPELSLLLAQQLHTEIPALNVFLNTALFLIGSMSAPHHVTFRLCPDSGSPELKGVSAGSSSSPPPANHLGCRSDLIMLDNLLWEKRKFILGVKMAFIV